MEALIPEFVNAIIDEILIIADNAPALTSHTIYFGGGTPSLLSPNQVHHILHTIYDRFNVASEPENSFEANPNDLNKPYLTALKAAGVNRLSIGMQSAQEPELQMFARRHSFQEVCAAFGSARDAGFENINLDLIYSSPNQSLQEWEQSLQSALQLEPEHFSLYALLLEEQTPLANWVSAGTLPVPDDDLAADMYDLASQRLHEAGYIQYEISNWAKPGYECQHNLQYWRNSPYIGLGPGAHGYAGGIRYDTVLSIREYIKAIKSTATSLQFPLTPAIQNWTVVTQRDEIVETVITNLRLTQEGLSRPSFAARFGVDVLDYFGERLARFYDIGLLELTPERILLSQRGRLVSNMIFRELV